MPRYTYKCVKCDHVFDTVQQSSEGERVGEATKRAIEENRALLKEERKIRVEYKDGD